jgi:hypothetical protein
MPTRPSPCPFDRGGRMMLRRGTTPPPPLVPAKRGAHDKVGGLAEGRLGSPDGPQPSLMAGEVQGNRPTSCSARLGQGGRYFVANDHFSSPVSPSALKSIYLRSCGHDAKLFPDYQALVADNQDMLAATRPKLDIDARVRAAGSRHRALQKRQRNSSPPLLLHLQLPYFRIANSSGQRSKTAPNCLTI